MLERLVAVLRQKKAVQTLLPDLVSEIVRLVPLDGMRFDIDEGGRLWSRLARPGQEPERPGLGAVPRLGSRETESVKDLEGGGVEATFILGIGEPAGRFVARRKDRGYSPEELRTLRLVSDLLTLGLRARPLDPPARPRGPFEEGPLF
jgi:hypothetical protein